MRLQKYFLMVLFSGLCLTLTAGCGGSGESTVAPRTEDEIAAYEAQVYAAEEEEDEAAAEAENQ